MKKILLALLIVMPGIILGLWRMQKLFSPRLEEQKRVLMDTYVTIFADGPKKIVSAAIDRAFERMQQVAAKFNAHNPKSPLYAFNNQGSPIQDEEILKVIRTALEVSQKSEGAFDITVYPLVKLWKFYDNTPGQVPPEQEIKECLNNIGYKHLILDKDGLRADKEGIGIDLGGIAKGYAIVEAIGVLKREGITSALIDIGGDVYALGKKRGKPWKVGIQHPRKEGLLGYVEVTDVAVIGSGDYQRFFIKGGRRYHHIFDPKTGYPTQGVTSVTLIHSDPVLAQAWAKIPFIMGPEKGLELFKKTPGLEAIIVSDSGEVRCSSGLKQVLREIR